MKPIQKSHSAIIPSTILYLDDIESIISLLNQVSEDITISDRDFQYDSLENLIKKVGQSPNALEISSRDPYVSIRFNRHEAILSSWLYAEAGHKDSESTFLKLKELLKRKQHWANHIIRFDVAVALFVAFAGLALLSVIIPILGIVDVSIRMIVFAFIVTYLLLAILLRTGMLYSIKLVRRYEKQTFWKQNSGGIILLVIGAVIAELIRWLANFILK